MSFDGENWTDIDLRKFPATPSGIVWDGTQFVAVFRDFIASSADGAIWTRIQEWSLPWVQQIASDGAGRLVVTSSDWGLRSGYPGSSWSSSGPGLAWGVTWTGEKFVVVGEHGWIWESADGQDWQLVSKSLLSSLEYRKDIAWGAGRFTAISHQTVFTSPTGREWAVAFRGTEAPEHEYVGTYERVRSLGDITFVIGEYGVLSSRDGKSWTRLSIGPALSHLVSDVAFNGTNYIAAGRELLVSNDGAVWEEAIVPFLGELFGSKPVELWLNSAAWNGEYFVAVGSVYEFDFRRTTALTCRSPDGRNWEQCTTNEVGLSSIVSNGSNFVALSTPDLYYSADGQEWTRISEISHAYELSWTGREYVVTTHGGGVDSQFVSKSGVEWIEQRQSWVYGAVTDGRTYVSLGMGGIKQSNPIPGVAPALRITRSADTVDLDVIGEPDAEYAIERSHDLNDWTTIAILPPGSEMRFTDVVKDRPAPAATYYRLHVIW